MGKAKITGQIIDRAAVGQPGEFASMTEEELREFIVRNLQELGFAIPVKMSVYHETGRMSAFPRKPTLMAATGLSAKGCRLNRSTQHFISGVKDEAYDDGSGISSRFCCGRENGWLI